MAPTALALGLLCLLLNLLLLLPTAAAAAAPADPIEALEEGAALPVPAPQATTATHLPSSHMKGDPALFPPAALRAFDADIHALVVNKSVNGARILGAQQGKVVLNYSLGYEAAAAAGGEPWFRLFSMTKPVTAALTLIMAEEGLLSLDDEFAMYVPELGNLTVYDGLGEFLVEEGRDGKQQRQPQALLSRPAPRNATIRELLTHTAGFAYGDNMQHPVDESYDRAMLQDFYRHTEASFLRVRCACLLAFSSFSPRKCIVITTIKICRPSYI